MASPRMHRFGSVALWLSLLAFGLFFANVVVGGPLRSKPWLGDVGEMLTLFVAVTLFVAGTLAREAAAGDPPAGAADAPGQDGDGP